MTTLTMPTTPADEAILRPVPWQRMAWVTWRQHRLALGGVAALLGGLALYLWLSGLKMHHAYAIATACRPASSYACQNLLIDFDSSYGTTANTVAILLQMVPALIGAFVGAPVLAREFEAGTFRYVWTLGVGRRRWSIGKLVPLAITLAVTAGVFSLLFSWYYQPFFADGSNIVLDPKLFDLRGVVFATWTLAAFMIGSLAGLLIRRVVPAIAATLAAYASLSLAAGLFLRQHYTGALLGRNLLNPPVSAWVLREWWTKDGITVSPSTMNQVMNSQFQQIMSAIVPKNVSSDDIKFYKGTANSQLLHYLFQSGYTRWTAYQPGSRFWPFQWIEGGWLLALSALLIAAIVWLVGRRVT